MNYKYHAVLRFALWVLLKVPFIEHFGIEALLIKHHNQKL
jgi:hypothetical protein